MTTRAPTRRIEQRNRALALGVGLFLFAVYLLSYRGGFHSVDEVSMFAVTESLVKFGRLNTDQIAWTQWTTSQREAQGFFGIDGHVYSKKGLVNSLAMIPLYWLGLVVPGLGMLQTASLLNPLTTAITAGLLFHVARRLGYGDKVAIGVAVLYGLGTIAWVYAKYLFSEPLTGLFLLATTYVLIIFQREGGNWRAALAGLLAGMAVVTRANNLFLVPIFGTYLVATNRLSGNVERAKDRDLPTRLNFLLPVSYYVLGLIPPGIMLLGYNWVRTGNPFQTGYDLTIFSPHLLPGLYKLLFSPLRGLFIYSPLLVLSLPGLVWLWQRCRAETGLIIGVTGATLFLFAIWTSGEGLSWGSRFLVPVVPFLCLALAPVLERALAGFTTLTGLLWGLGALSFLVQVAGVVINPWVYLAQLQADFGGEFFLENTPALSDFRYNQVFGQIRLWSPVNSDIVWWQPGKFDLIALGICVALIAVALVSLRLDFLNSDYRPRYSIATIVLTLFATYFLLTRYFITDQRQFGSPDHAYYRALNQVADQANQRDWMVTVAQNHYHMPMNRFKARIPIIGFARQSPPMPETAVPLLKASLTGQNCWLAVVGFPPAASDNAAEQWLALNAFKASDKWFDDVRLVRYGTEYPTTIRELNATMGKEFQLLRVKLIETRQPGQILPVEFVWLPLQRPGTDHNLFLQLLAPDGTPLAQHDSSPNGGYSPTSAWLPGEEVTDHHGLALPGDLPGGEYRLIAGLYDPTTGKRVSILNGGDFVDLGMVMIQ